MSWVIAHTSGKVQDLGTGAWSDIIWSQFEEHENSALDFDPHNLK